MYCRYLCLHPDSPYRHLLTQNKLILYIHIDIKVVFPSIDSSRQQQPRGCGSPKQAADETPFHIPGTAGGLISPQMNMASISYNGAKVVRK
jgi:hypothetical protein